MLHKNCIKKNRIIVNNHCNCCLLNFMLFRNSLHNIRLKIVNKNNVNIRYIYQIIIGELMSETININKR